MGAVFGIVATLVALLGLVVAAGNLGYLAMLNNAAKQRGLAGGATADYVSGRWKVAGGAAGVALLGLLFTTGGSVPVDVLGLFLGAGGGLVAKNSLDATRNRFRSLP
jgi:hypothetical protein